MPETYRVSIDIDVNDRSPASVQRAIDRVNALDAAIRRMQTQAQSAGMNFNVGVRLREIEQQTAAVQRMSAVNPFEGFGRGASMALAPVHALFNALTSIRTLILGYEVRQAFDTFIVAPTRLSDYYARAGQSLQTMYRTMGIGNDRDADSFMRSAVQFGIASPLRNREAIRDAMQLLTFRFTPDQVLGQANEGGVRSGRGGMLDAIMNASIAGSPEDPQGAMHRITVALGQIRSAGRVNAQDMLQLTNANIRAWEYLGDGLQRDFGIQASLGEIRNMTENNLIPPLRAVNWIVQGMQRDFAGLGNVIANQTVGGLLSQIADFAEYNVFARFGDGLRMGAVPGLQRLNEWLGANQVTAERWGFTLFQVGRDASEFAVSTLEGLARALERVANSDEFQNAEGFGRIRVAWDQLVVHPFWKWWTERSSPDPEHAGLGPTGEEQVGRAMGGALGTALGTGLTTAVDLVFGTEAATTRGEGFGREFGKSFSTALAEAFEPRYLLSKLVEYLKDPNHWRATYLLDPVVQPAVAAGMNQQIGPSWQDIPRAYLDNLEEARRRGGGPSGPRTATPGIDVGAAAAGAFGALPGGVASTLGNFARAAGGVAAGAATSLPGGFLLRSLLAPGRAHASELAAQFGNDELAAQFQAAGFTPDAVEDACAPIVAAGMARSFGVAASEADIARNARLPSGAPAFAEGVGATSSRDSLSAMLRYAGLIPMDLEEAQAQQMAQAGRMVGINTKDHYFGASGYDPTTGRWNVGSTGANGFTGGSASMTLAEMTRNGANPLRGFVGATVPQGGQGDLLQAAGAIASRYGIDPRALQAILMTEGAMDGSVGDSGQSFGPLQFHRQGQLPAYAAARGLGLDEAGEYARAHPEDAIEWAAQGYLGDTLRRGQAMGLSGADLATYGQREGQVSVSPERAGANYGRAPGVHIDQINLTAYNASDDEARRLAQGIVEHVADALADRMEPDNQLPVPAAR